MKENILNTVLIDFHQQTFRNITGPSKSDEFDDLTDNPEARAYAHRAADAHRLKLNISELDYDAIHYVFLNSSTKPTRFSDGSFPVWYGSRDLKTTFYETIFHWKKTYFDAPHFPNSPRIQRGIRRVFTVKCDAALIDLRERKLTGTDSASYTETRRIGSNYHQDYPGLLTQSARMPTGENIVIFKKGVLSSPKHHDDYLYEYDQITKKISVKQANSRTQILILDKDAYD